MGAQIGVSSFLWRQQHVVGHHTHTNLETDPDIRASEQDVRRVAPHHQRHWYHVGSPPHEPTACALQSVRVSLGPATACQIVPAWCPYCFLSYLFIPGRPRA